MKVLTYAGLIMCVLGTVSMVQAKPGGDGEGRPERKGPGPEARGERPGREEMLKKYDADKDGKLSESELEQMKKDREGKRGKGRPGREEMLKRFDKDGDGELSDTERAEMRKAMSERRGDPGKREEMLKQFDKDGDGQLNEEERAAARAEMEKRRKERENE